MVPLNWVLQSVDLMPKGEDGVNAAGSLIFISANSGMMVVLVRPRLALRVLQ